MMKKFILSVLVVSVVFSCGNEKQPVEVEVSDKQEISVKVEEVSKEPIAVETKNCAASLDVYLNDPALSGTNIRNKPKGDVIKKLIREDEDSHFFITVTESKEGWFKIEAVEDMEGAVEMDYTSAWIHGSVLGIDTRNYGGEVVVMYKEPYEYSKEVGGLKEQSYGLSVLEICGDWVKIKSNELEGWVNEEWLCGNPLTTCS